MSATTSNISNGQRANGNEGQNVALAVTGRRMHGAKLNRDPARDQPRSQRLTSHSTMTNTSSATRASVTRDRGIPITPAAGQRDAPGATTASRCRGWCRSPSDDVGEHQNNGHHDDRLDDETEAGQPEFDAVPPTQQSLHCTSVCRALRRVLAGGNSKATDRGGISGRQPGRGR